MCIIFVSYRTILVYLFVLVCYISHARSLQSYNVQLTASLSFSLPPSLHSQSPRICLSSPSFLLLVFQTSSQNVVNNLVSIYLLSLPLSFCPISYCLPPFFSSYFVKISFRWCVVYLHFISHSRELKRELFSHCKGFGATNSFTILIKQEMDSTLCNCNAILLFSEKFSFTACPVICNGCKVSLPLSAPSQIYCNSSIH